MIKTTYDQKRNTVVLEFWGKIDAAEAQQLLTDVQKTIPQDRKDFKVLTDLSGVEALDPAITAWIKKLMDFLNERGVAEVIRVIPDPAQDIGLNILSLFHYSKKVQFATVETREEAEARLGD